MTEHIAWISSKNRITVPVEVRRLLGVGPSDTIAFVIGDDRSIKVRPPQHDVELESMLGSVPVLPGASIDLDAEIADAMAAETDRLGRRTL